MESNNNQFYKEDQNSQPMTIKDWMLTDLLLLIPIANIVLVFVWAFGSDVNKSKKTYFQTRLIWAGIIFVLWIIAIVFALIIGFSLGSNRIN